MTASPAPAPAAPPPAGGAAATATHRAGSTPPGPGEPPTPADSLPGSAVEPEAPGDPGLGRRVTRLMLARTVVISLVLGLSIWIGNPAAAAYLVLTGIVVLTYALTIVYALLLRGGVDPRRLVWPQLAGDLAVTTVLVYVTGGAQSAYQFFYALSAVAAGALLLRRGAVVVTVVSVALMIAVGLAAWQRLLPLPVLPQVRPWTQSSHELIRALALNVGAVAGVGVLSYMFGGELQRTAASLESQRQVSADLYALNRDIVRSLASGLLTVGLDDRLLSINRAAAAILDIEPRHATGRPVDAVMPGLARRLRDLPVSGAIRRADLTVPATGQRGPLVLGISVSPLRDPHDEVIGRLINFSDLTELRTLEATMRRAERMASVGQLAAGVAHEIRNPLASISGSIELLARGPQVSDDDKALMAIVVREIDRLNSLITELLDFANPHPHDLVELDLAVLVRETVQVLRQDRGVGGAVLEADVPDRPVTVTADPARIRQVVWNLARNAAEAVSPGHGRVVLSVRPGGDTVTLVVEDDGPGIPPEHADRIFDPFFTTKQQGTGLGLATSLAIVEEHGGSLVVDSQPGRTRITVTLPRDPPAPDRERRVAPRHR